MWVRMISLAPYNASISMTEKETGNVPRTPDEPTPKQVLEEMCVCEPYIVSDLAGVFDDTSRWTLQRRLDTLVENGDLDKKKHTENRVSYWIERG